MVNTICLFNFVETPREFIIAKLSIRKLGSSSSAVFSLHLKMNLSETQRNLFIPQTLQMLPGRLYVCSK